MATLWQKDKLAESGLAETVAKFTIGKDRDLDLILAKQDVLGSLAHTRMLGTIGLLTNDELSAIQQELKKLYGEIEEGNFSIAPDNEDIHSEIEFRLTKTLGDTGKKIHSGRSRNDQVLLDLKLFTRQELEHIVRLAENLFDTLLSLAEKHKDKLLPGYTHLQLAMPSSFGLWFSAYAESLIDDLHLLHAAFMLANKNPLGSGAGYGGSFPLDRKLTTELLGFEDLNYNVVYAQMNRGKMERTATVALASVAATLSRLAMDCCLYMNQNFGFISFPEALTTGSSIMPHKKNPDVWELIRGRCNKLQNLPALINSILTNLPSGYHRDVQIIKEDYLPAFSNLKDCLEMAVLMLQHIEVKENILAGDRYKLLFTVETVNQLVKDGMPFRDAYIKVGKAVEAGNYTRPDVLQHTHEGSIGNLCLPEMTRMKNKAIAGFPFERIAAALSALLL
jgi:argininosuccinate lyase